MKTFTMNETIITKIHGKSCKCTVFMISSQFHRKVMAVTLLIRLVS